MYKRIILPSIVAVYLVVEAVLGYLMHTTAHFSLFAYSSVVLAFLMNWFFFKPKARNISTVTALLFTLGADFFLVVLNENYTFAMVLFSVAQLAYAARIYFESGDTLRRVTLFVRGGTAVLSVLLPLVILGDGADALAVISVFYFGQLILNCTFAFINSRRGGLILPIGLRLRYLRRLRQPWRLSPYRERYYLLVDGAPAHQYGVGILSALAGTPWHQLYDGGEGE